MKKLTSLALAAGFLLSGCGEPEAPFIGKWEGEVKRGQTAQVEFTATMLTFSANGREESIKVSYFEHLPLAEGQESFGDFVMFKNGDNDGMVIKMISDDELQLFETDELRRDASRRDVITFKRKD